MRKKIVDPAFEGFFLKFKKGGSQPNGTWHVPQCTESLVGNPPKCTEFYHDTEQTPRNGQHQSQGTVVDGWSVYDPYNGVGGHLTHCAELSNTSAACQVWVATPPDADANAFPDFESCAKAADRARATNPLIHLWTWWQYPGATSGSCWFSRGIYKGVGGPEAGHGTYAPVLCKSFWGVKTSRFLSLLLAVMGYKGPAADAPVIAQSYSTCDGDCDCGEGLPCGEYLVRAKAWPAFR